MGQYFRRCDGGGGIVGAVPRLHRNWLLVRACGSSRSTTQSREAGMQISIIGAGRMARVFAGQWQRLGHDIFIGARDITKARELALEVGPAVHHGTIEAASDAGDMILLTVKEAGAVPAVLAAGSGSLAGKPIIDCTNGVDPVAGLLEHGKSIAERIADAAPEAHVVKGFNLCHFKVWENGPPR